MWFPARVKEFGQVEITEFKKAVLAATEDVWCLGNSTKQKLAGDRQTNSIFFYNLDPDNFAKIIKTRAIEQNDVDYYSVDGLADLVKPLLDFTANALGEAGIIVRAQLARMQAGTKIPSHYDSSPILIASHRLHIPILTHNKLRFMVDGERVTMQEGRLYELNNQLTHSVDNPSSASTRIHLIIDFLPDFINKLGAENDRLEFQVRAQQCKNAEKKALPEIQLPKVIATSVVRGAHKSESHGGVYLIDLQTEQKEQVVDWNNCDIDFSGRGWDRGLRGICFFDERIFIAATEHIYEFNNKFKIVASYTNRHLRHAHEMVIVGRHIYITSTGFDSILRFDLRKKAFDKGWCFKNIGGVVGFEHFDPEGRTSLVENNTFHINNVTVNKDEIYISGRRLAYLFKIKGNLIDVVQRVPFGTHNVMPFNKGILYNDSDGDQLVFSNNYDYRNLPVPRYSESELLNRNLGDVSVARQAFGRGLCLYKKGIVIAGSSPSTISVYDLKTQQKLKSVNLSMDIRNAIHGLEIWPFD